MFYYNFHVEKYKHLYSYKSNEEIEIGTICELEFSKKITRGVVVSKLDIDNINFPIDKIKEIKKVLNIKIPLNLMELAKWMKNYYLSDYNTVLPIFYPGGFKTEKEVTRKRKTIDKEIEKSNDKKEEIVLNFEQNLAYEKIKKTENKNIFLLHGITGSGKTEIYLKLIEDALKNDEGSIFLVPEISLTPQMIKKLEYRFSNEISVIHSKMSLKSRKEEWEKIHSGEKKVVLGARSALFYPVKNLKYIIIDEEHENTYKQEDSPRYHAKNVAIKRSFLENCKVILGSATPSFETYFQAKNNDIQLVYLGKRYNDAKLPEYEIMDLNNSKDLLTDELLKKLKNQILKKEQSILILNRKAFSILIKCSDCKEIKKCPYCSVNLTYSKKNNILKCNHCGYSEKFEKKCFNCGSEKLLEIGVGTEKIEEELINHFGEERIVRMDSETMNSKIKLKKLYKDFLDGKYDILVGTQMAAKGFHFPNVTFVGIINADQILSFPDFRAGEKTFQLVTQAAGRSGRSEKEGTVLLQTYNPDSEIVKSIINNDYEGYYEKQMEFRKVFNYPPYGKIIKIIISSKSESQSKEKANIVYSLLKKYIDIKDFDFSEHLNEPQRAVLYKINERYRQIIFIQIKRKRIKIVKEAIKKILSECNFSGVRILVDVDPINML